MLMSQSSSQLARSHRENTVVDSLVAEGDVMCVCSVPLAIPGKRDGSRGALEHDATLLRIRFLHTDDAQDLGACVYFRGAQMIVERQSLRGVRVLSDAVSRGYTYSEDGGVPKPSGTVADEFLALRSHPHTTPGSSQDRSEVRLRAGRRRGDPAVSPQHSVCDTRRGRPGRAGPRTARGR